MKKIMLLILLVQVACTWHWKPQSNSVTILMINNDFSSVGHIMLCKTAQDTFILISKMQTNPDECQDFLEIGNKYNLNLKKESKISVDSTFFPLYVTDLYIEGVLAIPHKYLVYSSAQLTGLCVE